MFRTPGVFNILTSKCASHHNGVHFFNIRTSKSGANMWCFVHFDLENVLRTTTACTFSTHPNLQKWREQLPKVVRTWCVLYILTWKYASRHVLRAKVFCTQLRATTACNFLSLIWPASSAPAALASLLFDHPEPQIIGKTQCFATFLPFRASASSFFLLFLFYSSFF